jgi:hypothetical protein
MQLRERTWIHKKRLIKRNLGSYNQYCGQGFKEEAQMSRKLVIFKSSWRKYRGSLSRNIETATQDTASTMASSAKISPRLYLASECSWPKYVEKLWVWRQMAIEKSSRTKQRSPSSIRTLQESTVHMTIHIWIGIEHDARVNCKEAGHISLREVTDQETSPRLLKSTARREELEYLRADILIVS